MGCVVAIMLVQVSNWNIAQHATEMVALQCCLLIKQRIKEKPHNANVRIQNRQLNRSSWDWTYYIAAQQSRAGRDQSIIMWPSLAMLDDKTHVDSVMQDTPDGCPQPHKKRLFQHTAIS